MRTQQQLQLTPAEVYGYFKFANTQGYMSYRQFDVNIEKALHCILASSNFKDDDYEALFNNLYADFGYHYDTESHYATAIIHHNNSAWKSIENFLKRKPFIVDKKRCYVGFEFQLEPREWYRCTGWNEKGKVKLVLSNAPRNSYIKETYRKLLSFNLEDFKAYFKDKKFFKY